MTDFSQGDILKIRGIKHSCLIVSTNAFIKSAKVFHVCPVIKDIPEGPLHIKINGHIKEQGTVACEQIKLIDPVFRRCSIIDSIPYRELMNISDAIQGMFEYD